MNITDKTKYLNDLETALYSGALEVSNVDEKVRFRSQADLGNLILKLKNEIELEQNPTATKNKKKSLGGWHVWN